MTLTVTAAPKSAVILENYLNPALFISSLQSKKKSAALEEMVRALVPAGVTRHAGVILDLLGQRESMGSTGLGKGIAVPHARSALIAERAVVVARSPKGIEFESADGKPVHLLFLIVAPSVTRDPVYLQLIAEIVRGVRFAKARQRLLEAPDFDTVREVLLHAACE
jgi:mannitol/fructose-specific phosphotransferase system IIA component (Ntr-type)